MRKPAFRICEIKGADQLLGHSAPDQCLCFPYIDSTIPLLPTSTKFKPLAIFCGCPYKNEKVAARLQLGCCYYAAIKYVCNNWWRQSSQLERLLACLQQPCSFYQRLQAHRATTCSQLQLAAVTSKKTARTHSL